MDVTAVALQGLSQAQARVEKVAQKLSGGVAAQAAAGDIVDLTALAVQLTTAQRSFEANLAVVAVADEMLQHTLDVLA